MQRAPRAHDPGAHAPTAECIHARPHQMRLRAHRSGRRSRGWAGLAVGTKRAAYWDVMRETVGTGTGQAVFVPGEWRSLAHCLGLSPHTVHTYVWRIYRKLNVQSREELLVRVFAEFRSLPKRGSNGRKRPESRHRPL